MRVRVRVLARAKRVAALMARAGACDRRAVREHLCAEALSQRGAGASTGACANAKATAYQHNRGMRVCTRRVGPGPALRPRRGQLRALKLLVHAVDGEEGVRAGADASAGGSGGPSRLALAPPLAFALGLCAAVGAQAHVHEALDAVELAPALRHQRAQPSQQAPKHAVDEDLGPRNLELLSGMAFCARARARARARERWRMRWR